LEKPRRPKRNADGRIWELYWEQMERWKEWKRQNARSQGRHPGSTRHVGQPHSSPHNPQFHADKKVTDLDGSTHTEHSTDPRDIEVGWDTADTTRQLRDEED
jgi:hypothetical protein